MEGGREEGGDEGREGEKEGGGKVRPSSRTSQTGASVAYGQHYQVPKPDLPVLVLNPISLEPQFRHYL